MILCSHLIVPQVSESNAVRGLEEKSAKVLRLEASLLRSEQERDSLSEALFQARAEAGKRTRHLRATVQVSRVDKLTSTY